MTHVVADGAEALAVADELERWMEEADIDGFHLAHATRHPPPRRERLPTSSTWSMACTVNAVSSNDDASGGTGGGSGKLLPFTLFAALLSAVSSLVKIAWHRLSIRRSRKAVERG
ncbi:hypothetical protein [Streptomyces sp. NPDC048172]|uniref:hypothetical protein n=1 Tax=Streptomyces sp. NPDC048172 TaxID=3365505 RepID=UPI003718576E